MYILLSCYVKIRFDFPPHSIDLNQSNSYGIFMLAMWHVLYKIYMCICICYAMV